MSRRSNKWGSHQETPVQAEVPVLETPPQAETPVQELPVPESPKPYGKQKAFTEEDIRLGKIIR